MKKPTKRKAFNFLRSYFDVLNELEDDKHRLAFLMAIVNKQFLNEDPEKLDFLANLCYESQRHSIESSVKGWIKASNTSLDGSVLGDPPTPKGSDPKGDPKEEEEEEQEEEKEKGKGKHDNRSIFIDYADFKLSESEVEQINKVHKLKSLDKPLENFIYLNSGEVKSRADIMYHFKNWMGKNGESYKENKGKAWV